jgi:ABC-type multidrug transport system permease subunit
MWELLFTPWALSNAGIAAIVYFITCAVLRKFRRDMNLFQSPWPVIGLVLSICSAAVLCIVVAILLLALDDFGFQGPEWIGLPLLFCPGLVGGAGSAAVLFSIRVIRVIRG